MFKGIDKAQQTVSTETVSERNARPRWSSRSLASGSYHTIFYLLIRTAGLRSAYALLFFVVSWYMLRPAIRKRSHPYLMRRFPGEGAFSFLLHTWKLQWNFGLCLVDRAAAGLGRAFSFEDAEGETISDLAAEGKGVIVLSAHTGCWQMAPSILAKQLPRPISLLVHKEHGDVDKQDFEHTGEQAPYTLVPADSGAFAAAELTTRLRRGEILCLMGDRILSSHETTVHASFLGKTAPLPLLAYRLSASTGAPIVVVLSARTGPSRGRLYPLGVMRIPARQGRSTEAYTEAAGRFAQILEEFTLRHPYQFFNFFDLWE